MSSVDLHSRMGVSGRERHCIENGRGSDTTEKLAESERTDRKHTEDHGKKSAKEEDRELGSNPYGLYQRSSSHDSSVILFQPANSIKTDAVSKSVAINEPSTLECDALQIYLDTS